MIEAYIVMGNQKVKKSSTIRALTGAYWNGVYDVATNNNIIKMFIQIRSLQENKIQPQAFINKTQQSGCNYVLLALRIGTNGISYLHDFSNAGWNIRGIAVLNQEKGALILPSIVRVEREIYIPNTVDMPSNKIAYMLRSDWGWIA